MVLVFIALMNLIAGFPAFAEEEPPARMIHVVYDDSGSMIESGGQKVDTWCQAKYAMEVFAALLGEKDSLNIYAMSDYEGGAQPAPRLALNGADGQNANVAKVHGMLTKAGNTPFDAVRKAYSDLTQAQADEKWLVVLTDGEFQGIDDIDGFFRQKDPDVRIMFLGMGPNAQGITADEGAGIYFEQAQTSKQILEKITGICTRIFNSDRLDVNVSAKTLSFDVPMAELVVFAQGANAEIQDITGEDGKVYKASGAPVTVQYSERAAENKEDALVDRNLNGCLLTFKDDFAAGNYKLDVSGADTIEVYYKPNVSVAAYLTSEDGTEVTDLHNLKAGEYTLTFGLVKTGTTQKVEQSSLLGEVTYSATVTNNGTVQGQTYASGDHIQLEEGGLMIDVTAHYLEYNTVSTHLDYSIYTDKTITLTVEDSPVYVVTKDGIQGEKPVLVKASLDGAEISQDVWNQMADLDVQLSDTEKGFGQPVVKKSETPGLYEIYPTLSEERPDSRVYDSCPFTASYESKNGESTWSGSTDGVLNVEDQRSWFERYLEVMKTAAKWLIAALFVLGYFPWIKPRFPRSMEKQPLVKRVNKDKTEENHDFSGEFQKTLIYSLLPYVAQRGKLQFVPGGVNGVPKVLLKAARDGEVWIMNASAYAGRKEVKFGTKMIEKNTRKALKIPLGNVNNKISFNKDGKTYECYPAKKMKAKKIKAKKSKK